MRAIKVIKLYDLGFTIVEIIMVAGILVVMAAALLPRMSGLIKTAEEKSVLMECQAVVRQMQITRVQKYAFNDVYYETEWKVWDLQRITGVSGEVLQMEMNKEGEVDYLVYVRSGIAVTYRLQPESGSGSVKNPSAYQLERKMRSN